MDQPANSAPPTRPAHRRLPPAVVWQLVAATVLVLFAGLTLTVTTSERFTGDATDWYQVGTTRASAMPTPA